MSNMFNRIMSKRNEYLQSTIYALRKVVMSRENAKYLIENYKLYEIPTHSLTWEQLDETGFIWGLKIVVLNTDEDILMVG